MKKFLLLSMLLVTWVSVLAQDREVAGKVSSSDDGSPLPGVNVVLKGTTNGTVTDAEGSFKLVVPASGGSLIFSFIGFKTTEVVIGDRSNITVSLSQDVAELQEVVVTALNIERSKSSLGYATQQVSGDNIRVAREQNVNTALAGKIAGVQIVSGSGAKFGAPAVRIRGIRGVSGGSPLYVLDGIVIDDPTAVNMDNIQNINVLKGANAAALYGSRARDGVVVLTSKSGGRAGQMSIDVNQTTTMERVYILPEYQNEYGGGYDQEFDIFTYNPAIHAPELANLNGTPYAYFSADESWGPRLDGRMVGQWDSFTPGTANYGRAHPWSPQPNNIRDFFRNGVMNNTSVNIGKSGEGYTLNSTLTRSTRTGVMENTNQDKTFLNLAFKAKLSEKLEIQALANYNQSYTKGNLFEGYNSIGSNFNQWYQRQLNTSDLRKYWKIDGRYTSWNISSPTNSTPLYWDNPYAYLYGAYGETTRDVLSSKFAAAYEILPGLKAAVDIMRNSRNEVFYDRRDANLKIGPAFFRTYSDKRIEDNIQGMLSYDKQFGDFSMVAYVGLNYRTNTRDYINAQTSGGLALPGLYNVRNSLDAFPPENFWSKYKVNSYFGSFSFDWKRIAFLDATFRTDHDSRLPNGNNAYVYPSVSASFVFSELTDLSWLSFGKFRTSYASVGNELNVYQSTPTYSLGIPYGSNPITSVPNGLIDPTLRPATTSSIEVGVELGFLDNRIHTEFSYYNQDNSNELLNVSIPSASGGSTFLTNSINSYTRGWELSIGGAPVKNARGLTWDVNFNIAKNTVFIEDIGYGVNSFALGNGFRGTSTSGGWDGQALARANEEWGVIVGRKLRRDENGNVIVNASGLPLTDANQDLGHILPDFTGGIFNRLTYKNFEVAFTIDYQIGGNFMSISRMFGAYAGLTSETVGNNDKGNPMRNPPAEGGGLTFGGVFADGTPANVYIGADQYWKSLFGVSEQWIYDATFVKMREFRVGYNFPASALSKTKYIKGASVAIVANNPFLLYAKVDGIDPTEIGGDLVEARNNGSWVESGNLPGTRSLGVDIRLKF
ncbi:MAG: SusC/RagA family TonB-linked outer membrane protein [Cyclobacteriaceae bacterium]|nr:SusC/RagA family TonB-linked outer membrane protein [Cyclobacteriaceae bacterium]